MKKFYCMDCKKEKSPIGLRCHKCAGVIFGQKQKGKNNPNWKGGWRNKLPRCLNCGKKLSKIECKRCQKCSYIGKRNSQWKGGIKQLWRAIRNLPEALEWRKQVFERDSYTCQACKQHGGKLEAHHIESFKEIYREFLKEYDQFSIIEDRETLIRLALKYKPFWNIDNGKTLCKRCHRLKEEIII